MEIRLGNDLLWAGDLSLASRSSASFSQMQNESFACIAPGESGRGSETLNTNLRVNLNGATSDGSFNFSTSYTRPVGSDRTEVLPCGEGGRNTRTIGIETHVALPTGRPVKVTGDAGLVVTLTRRS